MARESPRKAPNHLRGAAIRCARVPPDPRDIVTPEAFSVSPELLGRPLAHPIRRLGAMLVDLVGVGLLSGLPSLVLGLAAAAVCVRAGLRQGDAKFRLRRVLMFALAAVILGLSITLAVLGGRDGMVRVGAGDERMEMSAGDAFAFVAQNLALQSAKTRDERESAARSLVAAVRAAQPDRDAARELVQEIVSETEAPESKAALQAALAAQLPARDAAPADPALTDLRRSLSEARRHEQELEDTVKRLQRPRGIVGTLKGFADDLGLGLGWAIVYFTAFTAWWKGRTPGKRLFGCRVIRLDGKPLTWWQAFNRSGGYAASLATGLLGFAELIWDPNRQALHDRISRTVVLRD